MRLTTTLAAALAIAVLGAAGAQAKPVDSSALAAQKDMHASTAIAAAKERESQDLRSPDARDAAVHPRRAVPVAPDAVRDAAPATQANAQPVAPAEKPAPAHSDPGVDWLPIALGVAASLLAIASLVALNSRRSRRPQRARVAA
jgi:hypothetical protein